MGAIVELVVIVAMAIGLALGIQAFLVKPYQIPSPSMEPTLVPGERVLVNRLSYAVGGEPNVGDVVVFHPPTGADGGSARQCGAENSPDGASDSDPATYEPGAQPCPRPVDEQSDQNFIKRIVAGPGDTLYIENGHPVVNGVKNGDEPYTNPCGGGRDCNLREPIEIPAEHYFMMGDNRGRSDDSRFWGPVPSEWIIGKAFFTYWPPNEVGTL